MLTTDVSIKNTCHSVGTKTVRFCSTFFCNENSKFNQIYTHNIVNKNPPKKHYRSGNNG